MIIAKNDEDKRSRLWRTALFVSSVLIILIGIYMLTKLFMTNPLEGEWVREDNNTEMEIRSNGEIIVQIPDLDENGNVEIMMEYSLEKDSKIVTIHVDEKELEKAVDEADGAFTEEMLDNEVSTMEASFNYSVDQDQLTLTEREYGNQLIFMKK